MEPLVSEEDEMLFNLEPEFGEDEIESIDRDPLDKKGFSDLNAPDEKPAAHEAVITEEDTGDNIDGIDLFLTGQTIKSESPRSEKGS